MSGTVPATLIGHGPEADQQHPDGPGEASGAREMVLIAEKPALDEDELTAFWCALWNEATDYSDRLNAARVRALGLYNGDALGTKVQQVEAALAAVQNDRLQDLRVVFQRAEELRGAIETLSRQLADAKSNTSDTDRDIKAQLNELRAELTHALRAPLPGPRGR